MSDTTTQTNLPPDPECMNGNRAEWANVAVKAFQTETLTDDEDALSDLICDLMHWADRHLPEGDSWDVHLRRAVDHYFEEIRASDD